MREVATHILIVDLLLGEEPVVVLASEVDEKPEIEVVGEAVMDAIPLRVMVVGSSPVSSPVLVDAKNTILEEEYIENLDSDFQIPINLKKVDVEVWINEFDLHVGFEYRLPREGDMTCTPLVGFITVYPYMLRGGFKISPFSF